MREVQHLHVNIGEIKIGNSHHILHASLGSCVGIAFLWKRRQLYGLAHCLLPQAPGTLNVVGGRFVTQAIPSLITLMKIKPDDFAEIEAVVAGGGNMTSPLDAPKEKLVGYQNSEMALHRLKKIGILIVHQDLGGERGRKIQVFGEDGTYRIDSIPRIDSSAS